MLNDGCPARQVPCSTLLLAIYGSKFNEVVFRGMLGPFVVWNVFFLSTERFLPKMFAFIRSRFSKITRKTYRGWVRLRNCRTDSTDSRTVLFCSTAGYVAWRVRLNRLLVGFRTCLKSAHFHACMHSFIHSFIHSVLALVAQPYWCNIEPIFNQYGILRIYWPIYNDCILTSCQYRKVVYSRYLGN